MCYILIFNVKRSRDHLIIKMGIIILVRWHLYIETVPWEPIYEGFMRSLLKFCKKSHDHLYAYEFFLISAHKCKLLLYALLLYHTIHSELDFVVTIVFYALDNVTSKSQCQILFTWLYDIVYAKINHADGFLYSKVGHHSILHSDVGHPSN